MVGLRSACVAVMLSVLCGGSTALAQSADAPVSDEDALIRDGLALRREGRDSDALPLFQRAFERAASARAQAQLGLCEQALGRWVLAERHVREALSRASDPWVQRTRATLESALRVAEQHLATIEVLGGNDGAEIWLDGERAATLPAVRSFRVVTGTVRLEERMQGIATIVRTVELSAGAIERVSLPTQTVAVAHNSAQTSDGQRTNGQQIQRPIVLRPSPVPVHPLVWAGVAGAGAGMVTTVIAFASGNAIEGGYQRDCQASADFDACMARYTREQQTLDTLSVVTGVGWGLVGVGAAAAGAGAVLTLTARRSEAVRVVWTGQRVMVQGTF